MNRRNPARNQERILTAATEEFARFGLGGARVDRIAARAGANKRMLYYYYGNKEDLFLAVLEARYAHIRRAELGLHLLDLDPVQGMRRMVDSPGATIKHPEFPRAQQREPAPCAAPHARATSRRAFALMRASALLRAAIAPASS